MIKFTVLVSSKSIQQFHIKGNPFYIYLFSVLRKVGLGIYRRGFILYLFRMVIEWNCPCCVNISS